MKSNYINLWTSPKRNLKEKDSEIISKNNLSETIIFQHQMTYSNQI
jgi:hypothetical protein